MYTILLIADRQGIDFVDADFGCIQDIDINTFFVFFKESTPLNWSKFIRETLPCCTANITCRSVRVVENYRVGRKVQPKKALLKLGTGIAFPKAQWAELVEINKARLAGNEFLFEPAAESVAAAETVVQKLRIRKLAQPTDEALDGDTAHVELGSMDMDMDKRRSVGCERLALASLDALGLPEVLNPSSAFFTNMIS